MKQWDETIWWQCHQTGLRIVYRGELLVGEDLQEYRRLGNREPKQMVPIQNEWLIILKFCPSDCKMKHHNKGPLLKRLPDLLLEAADWLGGQRVG